jgi:hypothetical protein
MTGADDSRVRDARDRFIARLLAESSLDPIPPGFARRTAELTRARQTENGNRVEKTLERALWAALGLGGVVSLSVYGREWGQLPRDLAAAAAPAPGDAVSWAVAIGACLLLTFGIQLLAGRIRP